MVKPITLKQFFLCLCSALLVGCGGGGGTVEPADEFIDTITVNDISGLRAEYNEGEEVSLRLRTEGQGADSLVYEWVVTFRGEPYPFTGQDTSSINFNAPEVTGTELVQVQVDIDLREGRLLGQTRQFASVQVNDLDRVSGLSITNINIEESTTLPAVDSLDTSLISQGTTWLLNSFAQSDTSALGFDGESFTALSQITYFDLLPSGEVGYRRCGRETVQAFAGDNLMAYASQCPTEATVNYYQNSESFRFEVVCEGEKSYVSQFTKLDDDTQGNYGKVDIEFSSYPQLTTGPNTCGSYAESIITSYEDNDNDGNVDNLQTGAAQVEFFGVYEDEPIAITVKLDDADAIGFYFLASLFNEDGLRSIELSSPTLAKLEGRVANNGNIQKAVTDDEIEIEVNVDIEDSDGNTERVFGSFHLKL